MYYYNSAFYGMHFFWWCFWVIVWVSFFTLLAPVPRKKWNAQRETPKDILLRRLAKGEINENEYESRISVISREGLFSSPKTITS